MAKFTFNCETSETAKYYGISQKSMDAALSVLPHTAKNVYVFGNGCDSKYFTISVETCIKQSNGDCVAKMTDWYFTKNGKLSKTVSV